MATRRQLVEADGFIYGCNAWIVVDEARRVFVATTIRTDATETRPFEGRWSRLRSDWNGRLRTRALSAVRPGNGVSQRLARSIARQGVDDHDPCRYP